MRHILIVFAICSGCTGPKGAIGPMGPTGATGPTGEMSSPAPSTTITVSPQGTAQENGAALVAALAGATGPALVRVEAGNYDVGMTPIVMQPYVDIEGAGEDNTTVSGSGTATLVAASITQLRFLTINHTGAGAGISASGASGFSITHVTVNATGTGAQQALALANGIYDIGDATIFDNSALGDQTGIDASAGATINVHQSSIAVRTASNGVVHGILSAGSSVTLDGADISVAGSGGNTGGLSASDDGGMAIITITDSTVHGQCQGCTNGDGIDLKSTAMGLSGEISGSKISGEGGTGNSIVLDGAMANLEIANSQLVGPISVVNTPFIRCVGTYDDAYMPVTCP